MQTPTTPPLEVIKETTTVSSKKWSDDNTDEDNEPKNDSVDAGGSQDKKGDQKQKGIFMLEIESNLAPFLVGVKGRNISLIRKFTGMLITIENSMVSMTPSRPRHVNPDLAWKMVMSACYGGILRWFETPYATKKGYPADKVEELQTLAMSFNCTLDLLRSRRGHLCLMLVPNLHIQPSDQRPSDAEIHANKLRIQNARHELMQALNIQRNAPVASSSGE